MRCPIGFAVAVASAFSVIHDLHAEDKPPEPLAEFRGVWIASVSNIDWPSKKGLTSAEQKAELVAMLDKAAELKLNAVIFQIRPMCDALYVSDIEPWSEYLTGTLGKPPSPAYDPAGIGRSRGSCPRLGAARLVQSVSRPAFVGDIGNSRRAHHQASSRFGEALWHALLAQSDEPRGAGLHDARDSRRGSPLRHRRRAYRRLFLSVSRKGAGRKDHSLSGRRHMEGIPKQGRQAQPR